MQLKILGSSSSGNCYILENQTESIIIECGVRIEKIKKCLNYNISKVAGCLISHEHKDHCKAVNEVLATGITCYASAGTIKGMEVPINHHRINIINAGRQFNVGSFKVIPFAVQHDAYEPLGFLINHSETGTVLFVTDTYYVKDTFRGLNNIIVEANYSKEILDQKMRDGATPDFLRNRILKSHTSLETCKELLSANDLSQVNNIVLIHLSDNNSNELQFKREVTELTGKTVYAAAAGMTILNFDKQPF